MMSQVVYAPEAEVDLVGIADFIARDKPEAARRWIEEPASRKRRSGESRRRRWLQFPSRFSLLMFCAS